MGPMAFKKPAKYSTFFKKRKAPRFGGFAINDL
jgi:hypothetical protein